MMTPRRSNKERLKRVHSLLEKYWDVDRDTIWHPLTPHSAAEQEPFPFITRGEGIYLFDAEGNRYVDAISSWWTCNIGHSHPWVVEAIQRQAAELQHSILAKRSHPRAVELASRLLNLLNDERSHVVFAGDGASAVEASLRIAVQYWYNIGRPERYRFAALKAGYHGDTFGAMSVGYVEDFHAPYRNLLFDTYQAERPFCAECPYGETPDECDTPCFESMESIIEKHGEELCAVIVEPLLQGAGGMNIYPAAYLRKLSELCQRYNILLIADEIATGFGRTGSMFAFQQAGIRPDILCLGKNLSGGTLPLSAAVVSDHIFNAFTDTEGKDGTFYHGHTFAGNPIACAAGLACLDVFQDQQLVHRTNQLGQQLKDRLDDFRNIQGVTNIRTLGMLGAFDLEATENGSGAERAQMLSGLLYRNGVLLRPLGNVVYLMLPLIIGEEELEHTVERVYNAAFQV